MNIKFIKQMPKHTFRASLAILVQVETDESECGYECAHRRQKRHYATIIVFARARNGATLNESVK